MKSEYQLTESAEKVASPDELERLVRSMAQRRVREMRACAVCTEEAPVERTSLLRLCRASPHPCEGHPCRCANPAWCFKCTVQLLWTSTNTAMRECGRFRAKCPFCKAEFCPQDLCLEASTS